MIFNSTTLKRTSTRQINAVLTSLRGGLVQDKIDLLNQINISSDCNTIKTHRCYGFKIKIYPRSLDTLRETKAIAPRTLLRSVEK